MDEIKSKSKKKNCGMVYVFLIKTPPVSLLSPPPLFQLMLH